MRILISLLCISFLSCKQETNIAEADPTVQVNEIKTMFENYHKDIRELGLTAEFKYLDNSREFFWVPPGYSNAISYDSVASVLKQNAGKFKLVDNRFETLQIIPLGHGLGIYTGRLSSNMTDNTDKTLKLVLVETGLVIQKNNGWKLLCGQTSILSQ